MRSTAALVAAALALAACSSSGGGPAAGPVDPSVTATLEQYRADEVAHVLQVQVTNRGDRRVRLSGVQLVWPGLTTVAPGTSAVLVSPGQTVDLPVDYGTARCTGTMPSIEGAVAVAKARWNDTGEPVPIRLPITDTRGVLARIYEPDCEEQKVKGVVDLRWASTWTDTTAPDGRLAARGQLVLERRRGGAAVTVTALRGSVVLNVDPVTAPAEGTPLVTLAADAKTATLDVRISQAGTCDDHVLGQSSQTFLLPVVVSVGGAPGIAVNVVPDTASQSYLLDMASRACRRS